jgi:cytidylate kinase
MIVTIDGPAAAGKSTVARALAERLGFDFLDTGAMYRAVTLEALRRGVPLDDDERLGEVARSVHITLRGSRVFLDGEDVSSAIRDVEVTRASRQVADSPAVRDCMVKLQRQTAMNCNMVTEGRDQGTVVFPDAACKVFLTARPEIRAARRQQEYAARGQSVTIEQVLADQAERDRRDADRAIAPMVPAPDAIILDSSDWTFDAVVDEMERFVREVQTRAVSGER